MSAAARARPQQAALNYQVQPWHLHAHLFGVTLRLARPAARQRVSLPVWIAGSYLIREFSKHLQGLSAQQGSGPVALRQLDKCTWELDCQPGQPLRLSYQVYAFDNSVRTAWLDARRGFFNGACLFLRVHGQEAQAHRLTLAGAGWPRDWQVATALPAEKVDARGFGRYLAVHYDELADSPVEMGAFWSGSFSARGVAHRFVVAGAPASFDGARLLADTQAICEAEIDFWHGPPDAAAQRPPHDRYVFMLSAVDSGYGGLEHGHSTALICQRADLPRLDQGKALAASDGTTRLLGLISHEYFHTWNVKRLRPAEFARYDYASENYTELLWFFEGFTSYYDDLLLRRAGLIDDATYLNLLAKTLQAVLGTPGRKVQSVAQASFDAWVKYYRQDENSPNATVSYYTKGALVALCLDLSLRQGPSPSSLDTVMRALWQRCGGGPMTEADLAAVLQTLGGRSYAAELAAWVHGTDDLPLQALLTQQGVAYHTPAAPWADQLGLRFSESGGMRVKTVLRDGAAERAGIAPGDEWLGVELGTGPGAQGWRLARLDDLPLYLGREREFAVLMARDQRLLRLSVNLPSTETQLQLSVADPARVTSWLDAKSQIQ